jgi:class 3 adenylate cyclase
VSRSAGRGAKRVLSSARIASRILTACVNHVMGDGIMALFGAPLAHKDHAVRACYAALRMQESVKRWAEGVPREHGIVVRLRIGLNSGEVMVRSIGSDLRIDYSAIGQTTHLAARMEQLAAPGSILLKANVAEPYDARNVSTKGPASILVFQAPQEEEPWRCLSSKALIARETAARDD